MSEITAMRIFLILSAAQPFPGRHHYPTGKGGPTNSIAGLGEESTI